ncbi:MAG: hypothetical protein M1816_004556 [Peltula sp. TS41687]|nr:MAG: hypothetical protein M1816_004556 [Peltula sp. TS41687]
MATPRPNNFNSQGFLPNGSNPSGNVGPAAASSGQSRVLQTGSARVLCVADVRGNLRSLNYLAKQARADYVIHTGDFGFYDEASLERIADKTLRHVAQYSPLLSEKIKREIQQAGPQQSPIKQRYPPDELPLSELALFLNKTYTLEVPVYTVWGACEDVRVLEKFRSGEYKVNKLHIIDEASSRLLDVGGVKLRLFGLGGAVVMHKLFDNGEGRTTIAGGQGTMWTTLLQMGELVDTANRVYDPSETRIFITHASPAREGLLNQLSVALKADFSISAGLHFRYGSSYNEFSVNPTLDHYRGKLAASKASFNDVWETVKAEVEPAVSANEAQQALLQNALDIVQRMPSVANGGNPFGGPSGGPNTGGQVDEGAFKTMWNFNLADAAFGYLVLEIEGGRIGTEMKAQGFNFAHRGGKHGPAQQQQQTTGPASTIFNPEKPPAASTTPAAPSQNQQQVPTGPTPPYQQRNVPMTAQPAQNKPPTGPAGRNTPAPPRNNPTNARSNQSPAAPSGPNTAKPATAQSSGANVNLPAPSGTEKTVPPLQTQDVRNQPQDARNGTGANDAKPSGSPGPTKGPSPTERKPPTTALFVNFVKDVETCRAQFSEEDQAKIVRLDQMKNGACVVHFSSAEEVRAVLDRLPVDVKEGAPRGHLYIKIFEDNFRYGRRGDGGSDRWHGSSRGGPNVGGQGQGQGQGQGGYKSGGASDSEGGRGGRGGGGFRSGPRPRGDRARGGLGGPGGRGVGPGGRGSFNNNTTNNNNNNAGAKPTQASGGEQGGSGPAGNSGPSSTAAPGTGTGNAPAPAPPTNSGAGGALPQQQQSAGAGGD